MGLLNDKTFEYPDIADIERQARVRERHISIRDLINVPIVIRTWHTGDSKFVIKDEKGNTIIDPETGKPKHGVCSIVSCQIPGDDTVWSFTTGSVPIKRQLDTARNHFMEYHVPLRYQGFKAVIKHDGKQLRLFTSKNAIAQPVEEHSDLFQTLEEAGSPVRPEDCKYGSTMDEETKQYLATEGNKMTQLVGDPNDITNDTTVPVKIRRACRKLYKKDNTNECTD